MAPADLVLREIGALSLVVALGALALRRLSADAIAALSRIVVDVALPALVFSQLLATTTAADLRRDAWVPVAGFALLAVGALGAVLCSRLAPEPTRPTVAFLVAVPNWIYLPLPIATAAWGAEGARAVLLVNVGALVFLWVFGPAMLRGSAAPWRLLVNPGLLATAAAIGAILLSVPVDIADGALLRACSGVGATAVPLGLLLTGAQLAQVADSPAARVTQTPEPALKGRSSWRLQSWLPFQPRPGLAVALVGRLALSPALCIVAVWALGHSVALPPSLQGVLWLVATMPSALTATQFVSRFGGDPALAAQAVLWGTLGSLVTVPIWLAVLGG